MTTGDQLAELEERVTQAAETGELLDLRVGEDYQMIPHTGRNGTRVVQYVLSI